ncbi:MAG: hypothetical protein IPK64_15825 [bacterium]|nr:hypothetical protein [bacterium]
MVRSPFVRHALGAALGALAGTSLCLSVLPMALQVVGYGSHVAIGVYLARLTPFAALVMAGGGWGVARSRHPLAAAAVFSLAGLGTGLMLTAFGLGRELRLVAVGAGAGWLYGLLGGLILGRVLAPAGTDAAGDIAGSRDGSALEAAPVEAPQADAGTAPVDDPRDNT